MSSCSTIAANNGEELDLISSENGMYNVPESAMDIELPPQYTSVLSGDWTLPRGIKLGDSIDSLYNAYNGNKGKERFAQGVYLVSYDYEESGSVIYHFDGTSPDGIIGELEQVTIEWYHDSKPNNSPQTEKSPSPPA